MSIYTLDHLKEGYVMFLRHLKVRGKKFTRLGKHAPFIAEQTLKQLWTGRYYKTSLGHYSVFYSRDFGMVVPSLLRLGHRSKIISTLNYALERYEHEKQIKTFITKKGKPVNFPNVYSPDSVAYMFRSIRLVQDANLFIKYKSFLQQELDYFYETVIDKQTGLVKEHIHFGGMRDHAKRSSSCYDTVMAAVLSKEAEYLHLKNPLEKFDYPSILKKYFWTGSYFKDALHDDTITADANIYPFWLDIIQDTSMLQSAILTLQKEQLDVPFPIRYCNMRQDSSKKISAEHLVPDWEGTAIWPMSGLPFIELVAKIDLQKAKEYVIAYKLQIESYGTFIEVYTKEGQPYRSLVFSADEGMIWIALWLDIFKQV